MTKVSRTKRPQCKWRGKGAIGRIGGLKAGKSNPRISNAWRPVKGERLVILAKTRKRAGARLYPSDCSDVSVRRAGKRKKTLFQQGWGRY